MQKIKMSRGVTLTFEEGCKRYLENCRQRNLREGTINHYRQSYLYFYKYFDPKMPIEDILLQKAFLFNIRFYGFSSNEALLFSCLAMNAQGNTFQAMRDHRSSRHFRSPLIWGQKIFCEAQTNTSRIHHRQSQ